MSVLVGENVMVQLKGSNRTDEITSIAAANIAHTILTLMAKTPLAA